MSVVSRVLHVVRLLVALAAWAMPAFGASLADVAQERSALGMVALAESDDASGTHATHAHEDCGLCHVLGTVAVVPARAALPAWHRDVARGVCAAGDVMGRGVAHCAGARAPPVVA